MDAILQSILTFVLLYKYPAIFLVSFFGALLPPLPTGTVLMASSFFAMQGYMNLGLVILVGLAGDVLGDIATYWLARKYGQELLSKIGLRKFLESPNFKNLESKTIKHPILTVFTSRFFTAITPVVTILVGLAKMPFRVFLIIDIAGQIVSMAMFCTLGLIFGSEWEYLNSLLRTLTIIVTVLILLIIFVFWRRLSRRSKKV